MHARVTTTPERIEHAVSMWEMMALGEQFQPLTEAIGDLGQRAQGRRERCEVQGGSHGEVAVPEVPSKRGHCQKNRKRHTHQILACPPSFVFVTSVCWLGVRNQLLGKGRRKEGARERE